MDDQISQAVWEGEIPVAFTLHNGDGATFYMSLPRHVYLSMNQDAIKEHYSLPAPKEDMWFSSNDIPLRWNFPVGVLYDAFGQSALPWPITVHTQDFPTTVLLRCPDEGTVKSYYWNSLKQAHFLKFNEIDNINNLSILESSTMWESFVKNDRNKFFSIIHKITNTSKIPRVPVRLVDPSGPRLMKQSPYDIDDTTPLAQFLNDLLPGSVVQEDDQYKLTGQYKISIQGILPPLDTPVLWIVNRLSNMDGFLYVVAVPSNK